MIGTSALAERLYVAWRERMEFVAPQQPYGRWPTYRPRPIWSRLPADEQAVWKHVAEAAGAVLADAMGAL